MDSMKKKTSAASSASSNSRQQGKNAVGFPAPAQFRKNGGDDNEVLSGSSTQAVSFASSIQMKGDESINGISVSENETVRQLTGGAVDLHSSGAKVENTSPSDSRLQDVGARSMAVGGQALIGDNRDRGHEIWHLAQQHQGRVQPTTSVNGQAVNDNPSLEKEADVMGSKIMQGKFKP